jgi:hypothetical protein
MAIFLTLNFDIHYQQIVHFSVLHAIILGTRLFYKNWLPGCKVRGGLGPQSPGQNSILFILDL